MVPIVYPVLHALVFSCFFIIPCRHARLDKPGEALVEGACSSWTLLPAYLRYLLPREFTPHAHAHTTCKCERKLTRRRLSKKRSVVWPSSRDSLSLSLSLSLTPSLFSLIHSLDKERGTERLLSSRHLSRTPSPSRTRIYIYKITRTLHRTLVGERVSVCARSNSTRIRRAVTCRLCRKLSILRIKCLVCLP